MKFHLSMVMCRELQKWATLAALGTDVKWYFRT